MNRWFFYAMKRQLIITALLFASCSSKDEKFCNCIEASEKLNEKTNQFFDKAPSESEAADIKELKENKNNLCADYQEMDGEKMRQLKDACGFEDQP